jgi:hypothetical protein
MGRFDQFPPGKHVCIFELERNGDLFTAEVICTVCGVYLSSQQDQPTAQEKPAHGPENEPNQ